MLLIMSMVIYGLIGLMPGDPVDLLAAGNPHITPEGIARLRALYGVDQPLWSRYGHWLSAALQGNFGYSRLFSKPVLTVLWPRLLNTVLLAGISFVLALALAFPLGMLAARRPNSRVDAAINLFCFAGISVPPFWLALLLIILFAVTLGWLPASVTLAGHESWGRHARDMVLPVLTLTLLNIGAYTRYIRSAMREALGQDYIRTARAKGVSESGVVWRHALRNALIPVATIIALEFGSLLSGALVTEQMFAYLGMGKLIFDAVLGNDYNLALVGLLLATAMILLANLLADLAYVRLDPRISLRARRL
jgi:peptide/nickel transport system permease protein